MSSDLLSNTLPLRHTFNKNEAKRWNLDLNEKWNKIWQKDKGLVFFNHVELLLW
jgi:hypothetical protein